MGIKRTLFNIKGMTRDLAASKFSPEFAYENRNMRIMATEGNTSGVLTNEKGNYKALGLGAGLSGTPIGQAVLDNELILFSTNDAGSDYIYSLKLNSSDQWVLTTLFSGDLNFSTSNPIEAISVYENSALKKVYWTDNRNQPRVINISNSSSYTNNPDKFNFIRSLKLREEISITRNIVATGYFAPGVLQYCFTYYSLYGQESNIFYSSPLYYVSYNNRGASPADTVSNSFDIRITGDSYDTSFDYIRVYAIHRTSLNATPQVRRVADLAIPQYDDTLDITFTDTGVEGINVDASSLFYIGGEVITAGTISQKDNTLFLGDITYEKLVIPVEAEASIRDHARSYPVTFSLDTNPLNVLGSFGGFYNYTSQLSNNSRQIKGFKYLETYRFGLQFQYKSGKWSAPIWIGDVQNTVHPDSKVFDSNKNPYRNIKRPIASFTYESRGGIMKELIDAGYIRVRPVIVYPTINDRTVICQGILCPTVYNAEDRLGSTPFAQASWFARPNAPCNADLAPTSGSYWYSYDSPGTTSIDSQAGSVALERVTIAGTSPAITMEMPNKGSWAEFRHNYALPSSDHRNCEIQCRNRLPNSPGGGEVLLSPIISREQNTQYSTPIATSWATKYKDAFFVDQSIITMHSPDIEFDTQVRSLDCSNLKLRIVGAVPLTAFDSNIDITTSTPPLSKNEGGVWDGFYSEPVNSANAMTQGWRGLISAPMWLDGIANEDRHSTEMNWGTLYVIYPWHKSGALNNTKSADEKGGKPAKLLQKRLANTRFSYASLYLSSNSIWKADTNANGLAGVQIFDSNEITPIKLPSQGANLPEVVYYGNIDKVITFQSTEEENSKGYPLMRGGYPALNPQNPKEPAESNPVHTMYNNGYDAVAWNGEHSLPFVTMDFASTDPISMKYKSTPHAVMALKTSGSGSSQNQMVLPTCYSTKAGSTPINSASKGLNNSQHYFWDKKNVISGVTQGSIHIPDDGSNCAPDARFGFLWLGELYRDVDPSIRFGGNTEEAIENNQWVPAGESVSLFFGDTDLPIGEFTVKWTEGDTYYQRYDCLKTYPFTHEDTNSIVDIVSFMCETRVNIDGRYDRNRGLTNNLYITPENFNLLNPVYSQANNFFNYRSVNYSKLLVNSFPNTITWTKTKTLGEEVDSWTNITLASTLDLDGDRGTVRALRRFNDSLIAFQDEGISQILYNESVQIASTAGVPIEIANSGKVSGKRYISNKIGCINKWSICSTPNGLYFYDGVSRDIYLFNGEFNNLSDKLGFHSWVFSNLYSNNLWNPVDFDGVVTYYDNINNDVLFITKEDCLAFSETLGQFSSFYDYGDTPFFANIKDRGIAIHKDPNDIYHPYLHHEGDYNSFYGEYKPYWTTVIVNPNPTTDKIFNNVEFRADSFDTDVNDQLVSNHTFDHIYAWNEYQAGSSVLTNTLDKPSTLKKKFRIWHAQIPRWNEAINGVSPNGRDRMRNPWLYLKLSTEDLVNISSNYRTTLHDLVVDYFE